MLSSPKLLRAGSSNVKRKGADQRDQKEGQVGGDSGKWINSGLSEQARFNCAITSQNCPGRLVAAGGGIHLKADPLKITPTHSMLLALSSKANGLPTSFINTKGP